MVLDLENSGRQLRREFGKLLGQMAGKPKNLQVASISASEFDIMNGSGEMLRKQVTDYGTDLLVLGPLYKLVRGDPIKEEPARELSAALDDIRSAGCAVLLEAHNAKAADDKRAHRPKEPYGASLWMRWPEFGIHLGNDGKLTHWRGDRDDARTWPFRLARGKDWPWTVPDGSDDAEVDEDWDVRRAVYNAIEQNNGMLSGRDIASRAGLRRERCTYIIGQLISRGHVRIQKAGSANLHFIDRPWVLGQEGVECTE